jgi:hypothetical protein
MQEGYVMVTWICPLNASLIFENKLIQLTILSYILKLHNYPDRGIKKHVTKLNMHSC